MKQSAILLFLPMFFLVQCKKDTIDAESFFRSMAEETRIDLSKKELIRLPKSFGELTKVEELTLQYDSLTEIPTSIGNLQTLKILNLYGNPIETLPEEIGTLRNLRVLLLGRTLLKEIPKSFVGLQALEVLALDETKIQLTEEDVEILAKMPNLKTLDLTLMREYKSLPPNLSKLNHLESIFLSKTLLEKADVARLRDELPKVRVKL